VNGSGKHVNWSICDDLGNNLLNPGETPHDNIQFLVFCAAVLRAVDRFQACSGRASPAPATTTGSARTRRRRRSSRCSSATCSPTSSSRIEQGGAKRTKKGGVLDTGVSVLPKLPRDAGDRNRTSPFAFTGNKFEFRAVSANQSIALPNIASTPPSPSRSTTWPRTSSVPSAAVSRSRSRPGGARAAGEGAQAHHLQRQRLQRRVAGRGRRGAASSTCPIRRPPCPS